MNPPVSHRQHYPALDGLRGVAILLVVLLHNFGFMNYFFFGWLGVDLFFVLSGFLITDILLNTVGQPGFLRNFYMRRILRIFPLFYLTLIICLLILSNIKSLGLNMDYYTGNQFWLWTYLQNWLYVFKEPYGDKMLLHTWSLAVEEQFYLLWPLLILLLRKPKYLLAAVIILLLSVCVARYAIWSYRLEDLAYSSLYTFTRIDGLCIGAMVALLQRINPEFLKKNTAFIVLLMAAVNFGFYFINNRQGFTLPYLAFAGYTTFAVLFGILVYEAVTGESKIIQLLLNNRPLKFFGRISYGLYVYHWPVYILLFDYTRNWITGRDLVSHRIAELCTGMFVTIIAVLISVVSYRWFEKPFLKLKTKYS
ncbi:MAG: acyltransferase family protein [Bacteroidota bacterium]